MAKVKTKPKQANGLTVVIAIIIIAVALFAYYKEQEKEAEKYTALNGIFTDEVVSASTDKMKIHFIDVGQGDCIFVEFPDGKNMLIDSGDNGKENKVISYLNELKVKEITLLIATHADADHTGGMKEVFEEFKIDFCLRPFVYYNGENKSRFEDTFNVMAAAEKSTSCKTKTYEAFLSGILSEGCGYEYFDKNSDFEQAFTYQGVQGSYSVDFLTPVNSAPYIGYADANDYSPIFTLTYSDFVIMFTGDAEAVAERELLLGYPNLPDVDVLKVAHHGSKTSTSTEFLNKINAEYAVIMCGVGNKYGHPTQLTLERLVDVNATICRTDLQGNIVIEIDASGDYKFTYERSASIDDLTEGAPEVEK